MATKRCPEKGCTKAPRCEHSWYIKATFKGEVEKGPVKNYSFLLDDGQQLPVTLKEAELLEARLLLWLTKGRPSPTTPTPDGSRLFGPAFDEYRERHLKRTTTEAQRVWKFEPRFKDKPLTVILDQANLEDYIEDRMDEDEDNPPLISLNRDLSRLSHFMNWCMGRNWLPAVKRPFYHSTLNPTGIKHFKEGERNRRFREGEEEALIKGIEALPRAGEEMLGRFYCALDAGLRRGEMQKVQKDDILWHHADGVMIRIRWGNAKSRKERVVPVSTERLADYLKGRRFMQYPFGDSHGSYVEQFDMSWNNAKATANVEDLHWHDLRHECGSRLAERGVPLHQIQTLMGHSKITTTQRYLNARLSDLAANMKKANVGR